MKLLSIILVMCFTSSALAGPWAPDPVRKPDPVLKSVDGTGAKGPVGR